MSNRKHLNNLLIEVLHVENCPHLPQTMENLKQALRELEINPSINEIIVTTQEDAEKLKFLGSTSIRVNGEDISPIQTDQFVLT